LGIASVIQPAGTVPERYKTIMTKTPLAIPTADEVERRYAEFQRLLDEVDLDTDEGDTDKDEGPAYWPQPKQEG
jgi:hypothetical protein